MTEGAQNRSMIEPSMPQLRESATPWVILLVVLLAGMAGPINYYKVPPLMPFLITAFHLSGGHAGFLMSVFAVVGIVLSIPAGFLRRSKARVQIHRFHGTRLAGNGRRSGSPRYQLRCLVVTRLMEGIGLNFLAIVAPTIIALYFGGKRRAIALGVWNAWYPLGSTVTFLTAPFLASLWGWRSVWWFGCLYTLAVGVLYFCWITPRPSGKAQIGASTAGSGHREPGKKSAFRNREVWIMSIVFLCFAFMYVAYLTWTPTFLHRMRGLSIARAGFMMSLLSLLGIVSAPCSGWLLGRVRSPRSMCIVAVAAFSALAVLTCFLSTAYVLPLSSSPWDSSGDLFPRRA